MKGKRSIFLIVVALLLLLLSACAIPEEERLSASGARPAEAAALDTAAQNVEQTADVSYTLETGTGESGLAFIGVGGAIDGVANPTLTADPGDIVAITLVNGDGVLHDLTVDAFGASTGEMTEKGASVTITFTVDEEGEYAYFCSIPGHRQAGMEGLLQVGEVAAEPAVGENIVHQPTDIPQPVGDREPELVTVDLVAEEIEGQLADGTTYNYFTFNGTVPGPMLRVREGDTVELHLRNAEGSAFNHSIDLHAVNGPGGGSVLTQTAPGEEKVFTFQARHPGIYVYHCATASVPHHITNGMYGLILVEPEGGLPPVDKEFYVMQGELYTAEPYGTIGQTSFDAEKMSHEQPEYYVFNGAAGALTLEENSLKAEVGDTVRIFFGVGGPNKTSSFHVIGEIFDRVYNFGSLTSEPLTDVQTVTVPPGGAWMVEFTVEVPGTYILVDHALSRLERGLAGYLVVDGPEQPAIYHEGPAE